MIAKRIMFSCMALLFTVCSFGQTQVEQWGRFETVLHYKASGNAFTDVRLNATFSNGDTSINVSGFYDGADVFRIRFMPPATGNWSYQTSSNIRSLNNQKGNFQCIQPGAANHGPVKVHKQYHFSFADGTLYYPVGTTAYAWNHMGQTLQQQTLQSLKQSGFNKLRMCVFPKNYDLVIEEPGFFPYEVKQQATSKTDKWDFSRFNPAFFQQLEQQIDALQPLGIEVDLIVFHPYDKGRWGFDAMAQEANFRYIHYLAARLASFRNIWWSVANEWDLVKPKTHDDWVALTKEISKSDPYKHLLSIHGSTAKYFEYWMPEITHVSVQDEAPVMHWGAASILRNAYYKPVVYDEVGYEGNLPHRWGRYSAEEMTYLMWMATVGGTYITHGETYRYKDNTDTIFWAKGGIWKGKSWIRAAFMRKILEEGGGPLEPADISRDMHTATAGNGYYLLYFGKEINEYWQFNLPTKNGQFERAKPGDRFKAEIIDTWEMTVQPIPEEFVLSEQNDYRYYDKTMKKIKLPMKPYLAIRLTQIKNK